MPRSAASWRLDRPPSGAAPDYLDFPSSVKKLLEKKDYVEAAAKLRGVAGELVFVVDNIELPGGLKIVGRQAPPGRRRSTSSS
jgi:hypothetical protein